MRNAFLTDKGETGPWVDIDLDNLCKNFDLFQSQSADCEVSAVVKCDAYGLGARKIAIELATKRNCQTFFVAYAQEGADLREALNTVRPNAKIYVFNGPTKSTLRFFGDAHLTPILNHVDQATLWTEHFPAIPVAVHVDTGMNRLGAPASTAESFRDVKSLEVEMVMSHLACASTKDHPKNQEQRRAFDNVATLFPRARKSLSASAGALLGPEFLYDLVRPGIGLYGGSPFDSDDTRISPVAALRAPVVQTRHLKPGETLGYGATLTASSDLSVATIALGYGDGFPRIGGNANASVCVNGETAQIAGRISMDLISIDISTCKNTVKPGDIVEFFGPSLSLHKAATSCNTIAYELLTGLGPRVDRRYQ